MAKILRFVALSTLIVTLGSTLLAIWMEWNSADRFLTLTQAVLSWPVIAGGLVVGAGKEFFLRTAGRL